MYRGRIFIFFPFTADTIYAPRLVLQPTADVLTCLWKFQRFDPTRNVPYYDISGMKLIKIFLLAICWFNIILNERFITLLSQNNWVSYHPQKIYATCSSDDTRTHIALPTAGGDLRKKRVWDIAHLTLFTPKWICMEEYGCSIFITNQHSRWHTLN